MHPEALEPRIRGRALWIWILAAVIAVGVVLGFAVVTP